jgi:hypothetical protein
VGLRQRKSHGVPEGVYDAVVVGVAGVHHCWSRNYLVASYSTRESYQMDHHHRVYFPLVTSILVLKPGLFLHVDLLYIEGAWKFMLGQQL